MRLIKRRRGLVCCRPVQNIAGFVLRVWQHLEAQAADCMVDPSVIFSERLGIKHMVSIEAAGEVFLG